MRKLSKRCKAFFDTAGWPVKEHPMTNTTRARLERLFAVPVRGPAETLGQTIRRWFDSPKEESHRRLEHQRFNAICAFIDDPNSDGVSTDDTAGVPNQHPSGCKCSECQSKRYAGLI